MKKLLDFYKCKMLAKICVYILKSLTYCFNCYFYR